MQSTTQALVREHDGAHGCPIEADGQGTLNLNFRRARLETVLAHLHKSAGLPIGVKGDVPVERSLDFWHDQPVSAIEALSLLKQVLIPLGCTLIQKGPLFSIIRTADVKKHCIPLPAI